MSIDKNIRIWDNVKVVSVNKELIFYIPSNMSGDKWKKWKEKYKDEIKRFKALEL
jgi:hypothetical protein